MQTKASLGSDDARFCCQVLTQGLHDFGGTHPHHASILGLRFVVVQFLFVSLSGDWGLGLCLALPCSAWTFLRNFMDQFLTSAHGCASIPLAWEMHTFWTKTQHYDELIDNSVVIQYRIPEPKSSVLFYF